MNRSIRTTATAAAAVAIAFALLAPAGMLAVAPVGTLDVNQDHQDGMEMDSYQGDIVQTFTAGTTGDLTTVALYLKRNTTGETDPLPIEIHKTDAGGALIGSASIAATDVPVETKDWVNVVFGSSVPVTSGDVYAIVIKQTGNTDAFYATYATDGTRSGFTQVTVGGSSGPGTMAFQTYVSAAEATPTPTPTPTRTPTPTATAVVTAPPTATLSATTGSDSSGSLLLLIAGLGAVIAGAFVIGTRQARS